MKKSVILIVFIFCLCLFLYAQIKNDNPSPYPDYSLTSTMEAESTLEGKDWKDVNKFMLKHGFEYTEHPHCPTPGFGHDDGIHIECEYDKDLEKHVFRFDIHVTPFLDRDRCKPFLDRQRNEMKSRSENSTWAKVQGNYEEWQRLEWKFKLPTDFKPSAQFCHIHQLKAHDGKFNKSPLITITPRSNADGTNPRMQIIHRAENGGKTQGIIVDDIPLSLFLDEWIEVQTEMHYSHDGYYSCKMRRIRDGKVLVDYTNPHIDLWRSGSTFIRSKFGLYRSLGGDVAIGELPKNGIKNESIWLADFKVYEKNTNIHPTIPHD